MRELLQAPQRADCLGLQVVAALHDLSADPGVLYVVPDPFIRIELWRIRRQDEHLDAVAARAFDERLDLLRLVNGTAIGDQEDLLIRDALEQSFQEFYEAIRVHSPYIDLKSHLSARRYG